VVGGYSYVPRRFRRDGVPLVLMQASDAMTVPEWQGRGIFTGLDDLVCAEAGGRACPGPSPTAGASRSRGFLRNGWQLIGHAPVWRLRFRSRRSLGARAAGAGCWAAGAGAGRAPRLGARRRLPAGAAAQVERLARFEAEADELSAACVPARGLFGERRRGVAQLALRRQPHAPAGVLRAAAAGAPGRLAGGGVRAEATPSSWTTWRATRQARARALAAFAALARERGMEEATALLFEHHPACRAGGAGLRPPSFAPQGLPGYVSLHRAGLPADSPQEDLAIDRWHLADGDRDAEHMSA
jgi:hypothetical protein